MSRMLYAAAAALLVGFAAGTVYAARASRLYVRAVEAALRWHGAALDNLSARERQKDAEIAFLHRALRDHGVSLCARDVRTGEDLRKLGVHRSAQGEQL